MQLCINVQVQATCPPSGKTFRVFSSFVPKTLWNALPLKASRRVYRWVHGLSYQDDQGRPWRFNAIECKETVDGQTTTFAWITDLDVDVRKVEDVATKGGRQRWHIENQGFNRQKNSGLNLEHAFSTDPELLKAYYYLLQIAHIILQILEVGSLLRAAAAEFGRTPRAVVRELEEYRPPLAGSLPLLLLERRSV